MLSIGNKIYRNMQEQVGYNTECIEKLAEAIDGITFEDKLVIIANNSGTFTPEELDVLNGPLAFISNGSRVWIKDSETLTEFVFKAIDIKAEEIGSAYFNVGGSKIVVTRATGAFAVSDDLIITTYSKSQIDSIVSAKANTSDVYNKTQTYSQTEVNNALALKANLAGANFTGAITSPSIIQDMTSQYRFDPQSLPTGYSRNIIYGGIVQNGNKLTIVVFGTITKTSDTPGDTYAVMARVHLPHAVMEKIYPYTIAGQTIVDSKTISLSSAFNVFVSKTLVCLKIASDDQLIYPIYDLSSLTKDTPYFFRIEHTILLSDNLAVN